MPRNGKGGARDGTPGTNYANRTDLASGKIPVSAAPNQAYGEAAAQRAAQGVIPMAQQAVATAPQQAGPAQAGAMQQQMGGNLPVQPGSLPWLGPTNRPDEPVTAGLPFGPGPGPEAQQIPRHLVSSLLSSLAAGSHSAQLTELAANARNMGL